jgi:polyferredoxin
MRSHVGLSVLHDRAPLFAKLRDGAIRNAYAVKISNKTAEPATFVLSIAGVPGAAMTVAEDGDRQERLTLDVPTDSIGTFRVLVFAPPGGPADGSRKLGFILRNSATGESTEVGSVFMGPAR